MDHIRLRDWYSIRRPNEDFVDDFDIDNCVTERIIRNKFWDPLISSDEGEPVGPINWKEIYNKKIAKERKFRLFVPGFRLAPPHPKISALTQDEQRQCIKVLSASNPSILPKEFVGRPSKADFRVFEEKKEVYAAEQKEYIAWAKQLWVTTNCIRALRPKPIIEMIYEAEFKMQTHMIQCLPDAYTLAAQIPLQADNQRCDIILPKTNLVSVDITNLPIVFYPNINEAKVSVLQPCAVPEPCLQHPCKFKLPNETAVSLLPLTEVNKELAQFALENGADYIASEKAIQCLLENDRSWTVPVSVCEVIGADGGKSNVVVLGNEIPIKKDTPLVRSYKAFKHLLLKTFTWNHTKERTISEGSNSSQGSVRTFNLRTRRSSVKTSAGAQKRSQKNTSDSTDNPSGTNGVFTSSHKAAVVYTNTFRKITNQKEASDDSDDDERLEIDLDDDTDKPEVSLVASLDKTAKDPNTNGNSNHDTPKITQAQTQNQQDYPENGDMDIVENGVMNGDNHDANEETLEENIEDQIEIGRFTCVCKGSEFAIPAPRSYRKWQIKNNTTKEHVNVIIHSSHKLRNDKSNEVILEPIVEYQLEIGGTVQSPEKLRSLAFSLMLRKNADLINVRLDGMGGEIVTIDTTNLKDFTAAHGDFRQDLGNIICTALNQLAGLLPGTYLLRHEPSHGSNALLLSRAAAGAAHALSLRGAAGGAGGAGGAAGGACAAADEARALQAFPRIAALLLPVHKYRRQLPLAFTYDKRQVAKEPVKPVTKRKLPPAALQWPKKKRGKKKKKRQQSG